MRYIIALILSSSMLMSNHIFWMGNYDKALQKAREQNKILMVLLIKNNCQKCKNIVKNFFTNKRYITRLNTAFTSVIVNADNKHSYPIEMYWTDRYPTLFFVDPNREIFLCKPIYETLDKKELENILNMKR